MNEYLLPQFHRSQYQEPRNATPAEMEEAWLRQHLDDVQRIVRELKEGYSPPFDGRPDEIEEALELLDKAADQIYLRANMLDQFGDEA